MSSKKRTTKRLYRSSREHLLNAAESVLDRLGPARLTVDAVVAQARLSKGAFFYHFKTKRDLITAMGERLYQEAARRQAENVAAETNEYGGLTRAYVRLSLTADADFDRRMRSYALAMIALVQEDPTLIPMVRAANRAFFQQLEADGLPGAQRRLVVLAVQGLWLSQALHFHYFSEEQIAALGELLVRLTEKPLS